MLGLVLDGTKIATASALSEYPEGELPEPGSLSILLDSGGHPQALIATTAVQVVPFNEVGADHARAEGEGDLSVEYWRTAHSDFFGADATGEPTGTSTAGAFRGRLPTLTCAQTGGAGVVIPAAASAASISSRLIPIRYMIVSR